MVSLCGRGFDSLQLHPISKKAAEKSAAFFGFIIFYKLYLCFHTFSNILIINKFSVKAFLGEKYDSINTRN